MSTKSSESPELRPPSFDIVLATVGRRNEIARLLDSLAAQSHRNFRLIVVDQNPDERLVPLLEQYEDVVRCLRLTSDRGLSRARNVGLRAVTGDIVAFADDDCWYPVDLLARVGALLGTNPSWDGVTGSVIDESGRPSSARWSKRAGALDRINVWTRGVSISVFLRRGAVERIGEFDETLGIGAGTDWGSGEETDYLLRALERGCSLYYEPTLNVFHPQTRSEFTDKSIAAGRLYGLGMGHVIRKHGYPWWFGVYHAARAAGGAALALLHGDAAEARFHLAVARGRASGWLGRTIA
jgi:glycosyltransferase involved in cell wall biosynthesis